MRSKILTGFDAGKGNKRSLAKKMASNRVAKVMFSVVSVSFCLLPVPSPHVQTYSTWTSLYRTLPPDMFKLLACWKAGGWHSTEMPCSEMYKRSFSQIPTVRKDIQICSVFRSGPLNFEKIEP